MDLSARPSSYFDCTFLFKVVSLKVRWHLLLHISIWGQLYYGANVCVVELLPITVDSSDKAIVWMKYLMLFPLASFLKQGKEALKRKGDSKVGKAARSKAWVLAWISYCIMLIVIIRMMMRHG